MANKKDNQTRNLKINEDLSDYICKFAYGKEQATFVCESTLVPGKVIDSNLGQPTFVKVIEEDLRKRGAKIVILTEKEKA
ncbi:MAG: hypothetical protein HY929_03175 [Euryarchaeota archaeon]|nr:hypothetical protein [Euryarchaeota archaeon]